jgi:hypothetical protein
MKPRDLMTLIRAYGFARELLALAEQSGDRRRIAAGVKLVDEKLQAIRRHLGADAENVLR